LRQVLPEGWDFQLTLNKELTQELVSHSEYFFNLVIMPMAADQNRAYCILKDRLDGSEALLKAALDQTFKQDQALKSLVLNAGWAFQCDVCVYVIATAPKLNVRKCSDSKPQPSVPPFKASTG
jgi:hypothetical protein